MLVLGILKTEKVAFAIVLFPTQNIPDEGHYLFRKQVGSALTETENWNLLVDCISRDGRKMLDAGVHLSDKRILLRRTTHTVSNTIHNILPNPLMLLQMVRKQHILLFLKCFKFILPCL
jgi:hypothetical protein